MLLAAAAKRDRWLPESGESSNLRGAPSACGVPHRWRSWPI